MTPRAKGGKVEGRVAGNCPAKIMRRAVASSCFCYLAAGHRGRHHCTCGRLWVVGECSPKLRALARRLTREALEEAAREIDGLSRKPRARRAHGRRAR